MMILRDDRADINATDSQGRTPFSYSASNHDLPPLTMLLQRQNIDINVADPGEQIALFYAAKAGNDKATGLLLNCPDIEANVLDRNYLTPLWHAGSQGLVAVVNKLLWCPIIEFCPQNERLSPLIAVVDERYHTIFKVLLESGKVNHHATDSEGRSAFHC